MSLQTVSYQPAPLAEPVIIGRTTRLACEGRDCPDRTAPVYVALGSRGLLLLCAACRATQARVVRALLPILHRGGER